MLKWFEQFITLEQFNLNHSWTVTLFSLTVLNDAEHIRIVIIWMNTTALLPYTLLIFFNCYNYLFWNIYFDYCLPLHRVSHSAWVLSMPGLALLWEHAGLLSSSVLFYSCCVQHELCFPAHGMCGLNHVYRRFVYLQASSPSGSSGCSNLNLVFRYFLRNTIRIKNRITCTRSTQEYNY